MLLADQTATPKAPDKRTELAKQRRAMCIAPDELKRAKRKKGDFIMTNNKRVAIVEMFGNMIGDNSLRVVWDGDISELNEAIRVIKSQTKERWTRILVAISADSADEVYRKRGFKVSFPAQAIANVQRNLAKLGA